MSNEVSRQRAAKRVIEIERRISRQEAEIRQARADGHSTELAEDTLQNLRRSLAIFTEHYLSLGGRLEDLSS